MLEAIARQTGCAIPGFTAPTELPLSRWAHSGLMALSGPKDGAALVARRDICARIAELAYGVEAFARPAGMPVTVDETVVTERAAFLGLTRGGAVSANGMCRMIRAADGWLAVNLPRPDDADMLPAWIGCEAGGDPWAQIARVVQATPCDKLVTDAQTLGLAVARLDDAFAPSWAIAPMGKPRAKTKKRPLVLDMSGLWAGPLCGALLAEAGADVIKVESTSRPDGARMGSRAFFARLNAGKRMLALDLPRECNTLRRLFAVADIVIESARPRVLTNWGFTLPEIFAANPHLTWISITAYGRANVRANWVGFGDEVAAAAGLVIENAGQPMFVGDAIADPLTGLAAAASAFACLAAGGGFHVDANLFAAARYVAEAPPVAAAVGPLEPSIPVAKLVTCEARALGADTAEILRQVPT